MRITIFFISLEKFSPFTRLRRRRSPQAHYYAHNNHNIICISDGVSSNRTYLQVAACRENRDTYRSSSASGSGATELGHTHTHTFIIPVIQIHNKPYANILCTTFHDIFLPPADGLDIPITYCGRSLNFRRFSFDRFYGNTIVDY